MLGATDAAKPVVIASANGNTFTNGGRRRRVATAFRRMTEGTDVLDALIAGVNLVELDPADDSVGYGGLPNADGVVQLDACCMHGPKQARRRGRLPRGRANAVAVAKAVLEQTDHHLLVGKDAQDFARTWASRSRTTSTPTNSRKLWLEWKRRIDPRALPRSREARRGRRSRRAATMVRDGLIDRRPLSTARSTATASTPKGEICGVTTTSGLAWKIPGPRRRLADPRRRALRRRRGRRRRIDGPRRSQSLQPVLVPDRRADAPGHAPEGRRHGSAAADQGQHRREAAADAGAATRTSTSTSTSSTPRASSPASRCTDASYAVCTENGPQTLDTTPLIDAKAP